MLIVLGLARGVVELVLRQVLMLGWQHDRGKVATCLALSSVVIMGTAL